MCTKNIQSRSQGPYSVAKYFAKGSMASILLETGQSNDANLVSLNGTSDLVMNKGPTGARRASVNGLLGFGPEQKTGWS